MSSTFWISFFVFIAVIPIGIIVLGIFLICSNFLVFSQFGPENTLCVSSDGPNCVQLVDFDNDSDLDVLYTAEYDQKMVWVAGTIQRLKWQ